MKLWITILATLAALAIAWMLLSSPHREIENLPNEKLEEKIAELEKELQETKKILQELREDVETQTAQAHNLEASLSSIPTRISTPPPTETTKAKSETLPSFSEDPRQFVTSVMRDSENIQAERQRNQILEIQIASMKDKLNEAIDKTQIDATQKYQLENLYVDLMRRKSQIRGTRQWWEYTNDEWNTMREQLRELDKEKTQKVSQIVPAAQLKKFQQWEKKSLNIFRMGPYGNPRGEDF